MSCSVGRFWHSSILFLCLLLRACSANRGWLELPADLMPLRTMGGWPTRGACLWHVTCGSCLARLLLAPLAQSPLDLAPGCVYHASVASKLQTLRVAFAAVCVCPYFSVHCASPAFSLSKDSNSVMVEGALRLHDMPSLYHFKVIRVIPYCGSHGLAEPRSGLVPPFWIDDVKVLMNGS